MIGGLAIFLNNATGVRFITTKQQNVHPLNSGGRSRVGYNSIHSELYRSLPPQEKSPHL
jgi:hypothetical protein